MTSYVNAVVGFRFTVLGFYLAAVGFIVGRTASRASGVLLLGITISLWLIESRNRSLSHQLSVRGAQIEHEQWGYDGNETFDPFYNRQIKLKRPGAPPPPPPDVAKIWGIRLPFVVGYTLALDVLFTTVGAYAIYTAIRG